VDLLLGFGPLQALMDDPDITDIHVRGSESVWTKRRDGTRVSVDPIVDSTPPRSSAICVSRTAAASSP
jgi:Flp pilus assembly CpaF family ATPase